MKLLKLLAVGLVAAAMIGVLPGSAFAQVDHGTMHGGPATGETSVSPDNDPAVRAYVDAMNRMHDAMSTMSYSGNPDVDFARGMIPHHQAAIDMARTLLEHGSDPEMRLLAAKIIEAQEREIGQLKAWLEENAAE